MRLKYLSLTILSLPLLPILYFDAKRVRRKIPQLPEASDTEGFYKSTVSSQKPLKLLTIGESTIAGVGVESHKEGFSGMLAKELSEKTGRSIDWKVYAKSGYTSKDIIEKILPTINEKEADIIVLGMGANDAFTLNTPWKWRNNIIEIIIHLQNKYPQAQIYFTSMPPIKKFPAFSFSMHFVLGNLVEILGQELARTVQSFENVSYHNKPIDIEKWCRNLGIEPKPELFFSDGVHPSEMTYQIWAKETALEILKSSVIYSPRPEAHHLP